MKLAGDLLVNAAGLSEVQVRNTLSRLYYANFHVAAVLTGGKGHAEVIKKLTDSYGVIGQRLKAMHDLRSRMDYDPGFFIGWQVDLRGWHQEKMQEGIGLYDDLLRLWKREEESSE